jgi:hypothetical protein
LFAGDAPFLNFVTALATISQLNGACNTYSRFSLTCFKTMDADAQIAWYDYSIGYLLGYQNQWP